MSCALSATTPPQGIQSTRQQPLSCGAFGFERGDVGCGRQAIQWHVDEQSVAAGGSSARGGLEAFPLGAAGIVDVHVGIDEAGENRGVAKIVELGVRRDCSRSDDVQDAFAFDEKSCGADRGRSYDALGNEGAESHSETRSMEQSARTAKK